MTWSGCRFPLVPVEKKCLLDLRRGEGIEVETLRSKQGKIYALAAVAVVRPGDLKCYSLGVAVFVVPVRELRHSLVLDAFEFLGL